MHPKLHWQCLSCFETRLGFRTLPKLSGESSPCGNVCAVPASCRVFECLHSPLVSVNASRLARRPLNSPRQPGDSVGSSSSPGKIVKTSRSRSGHKLSVWVVGSEHACNLILPQLAVVGYLPFVFSIIARLSHNSFGCLFTAKHACMQNQSLLN